MSLIWDLDITAPERLRFAIGEEAVRVSTGPQASRALQDKPSHSLVIIGPDIPLDSACELAERERVERPEVGVILLRHRLEVAGLAQSLRSGVREVVQSDDQTALADAVRRSRDLTAAFVGSSSAGLGREGKIVTVFSAKGGVGKTTMATNVATYLASTGSSTLLIDLDLMFGDVAICLQITPQSSIQDLVAMTGHLDVQGLSSVVSTHHGSGLDIVAAPADPGDAERIPVATVAELLRVARAHYAYVIVDTPPSLTEQVLAAFDMSDLTILIATLDIPAVKNLRIAINTLETLGASKDARTVVLNRADAKSGLSPHDVETALQHPIAANVPTSASVPASINRGVPVVLDEPNSPVAAAIREVADVQIRERFGETITRPNAKRHFRFRRGAA